MKVAIAFNFVINYKKFKVLITLFWLYEGEALNVKVDYYVKMSTFLKTPQATYLLRIVNFLVSKF